MFIILNLLELRYSNPFFSRGVAWWLLIFLIPIGKQKLVNIKHNMHVEQCKRHYLNSEWIVYPRRQFKACFEQNIENDNKHIFFFQGQWYINHSESRVLSVIKYQCNALLPSLSKASKSAPYFEIMWCKNDVWPYWAATWTAWHNNQNGEQSNRRPHLTHRKLKILRGLRLWPITELFFYQRYDVWISRSADKLLQR